MSTNKRYSTSDIIPLSSSVTLSRRMSLPSPTVVTKLTVSPPKRRSSLTGYVGEMVLPETQLSGSNASVMTTMNQTSSHNVKTFTLPIRIEKTTSIVVALQECLSKNNAVSKDMQSWVEQMLKGREAEDVAAPASETNSSETARKGIGMDVDVKGMNGHLQMDVEPMSPEDEEEALNVLRFLDTSIVERENAITCSRRKSVVSVGALETITESNQSDDETDDNAVDQKQSVIVKETPLLPHQREEEDKRLLPRSTPPRDASRRQTLVLDTRSLPSRSTGRRLSAPISAPILLSPVKIRPRSFSHGDVPVIRKRNETLSLGMRSHSGRTQIEDVQDLLPNHVLPAYCSPSPLRTGNGVHGISGPQLLGTSFHRSTVPIEQLLKERGLAYEGEDPGIQERSGQNGWTWKWKQLWRKIGDRVERFAAGLSA